MLYLAIWRRDNTGVRLSVSISTKIPEMLGVIPAIPAFPGQVFEAMLEAMADDPYTTTPTQVFHWLGGVP